MYPHERSLVKEMQGRPFVLLGVNTDGEKSTAVDAVKEHKLNWRSFYDGRGGPIVRMFQVQAFPTVMLIDHQGVIRFPNIRGDALDTEIEKLVSLAEGAGMVGDLIEPEFRTFRDKTGKHRIKAIAEAFQGDSVVLRKEDDSRVTIKLDDLSKADQRYLKIVAIAGRDTLQKPGTPPQGESPDGWRTFRDATGKFEVEARLRTVRDGKAVLEKRDGTTIDVPLDKLSQPDRKYVEDQER